MTKPKEVSRRSWSKIYVPQTLADVIGMLAKREDYKREDIHLFLFDTIKRQYPEQVAQILQFLGKEHEDWMNPPA
jgi:hypothetical protein